MRNVGYTKFHTIRMYLRDWYTRFMLKVYPPFGRKFSDGIVKDGVVELKFRRSPDYPKMKKVDGVWVEDEDDDGIDAFWVARW